MDRQRRSIYILAKRNMRYPLFDAFDWPDLHNSCSRRVMTTTAPQALLLLNVSTVFVPTVATSFTVPVEPTPPVTLAGLNVRDCGAASEG